MNTGMALTLVSPSALTPLVSRQDDSPFAVHQYCASNGSGAFGAAPSIARTVENETSGKACKTLSARQRAF
jgi:hypothetical protein